MQLSQALNKLDHQLVAGGFTKTTVWTLVHQISDVWSQGIDYELGALRGLDIRIQRRETFNFLLVYAELAQDGDLIAKGL